MNRVLPVLLTALAALAAAPAADAQRVDESDFRIGARSRAKVAQLEAELRSILSTTLPTIRALYEDLDSYLDVLERPETLATPEVELRDWGAAEVAAYQAAVDVAFDEIRGRLEGIYEVAMATAEERAQRLAGMRSPLDRGVTGDGSLDLALTAFEETMRGAVGLRRLSNMRSEYKSRETEIVQIFSSFGVEGAQDALDGRLLVFVGGKEHEVPRAMLGYRHDGGASPRAYDLVQVVRHRVMRGDSIVHDLGWRPMPGPTPGRPETLVDGRYLIAPSVEPVVRTDVSAFDDLRDSRIVVDIQSGVVGPGGALLGSVDWRVEFHVSTRGELVWNLSERRAVHDPYGTELRRVMPGLETRGGT